MFARAFGQATKEGFAAPADSKDATGLGIRDLQQYFTDTLPNVLVSKDKNLDLESLTSTYNTKSPTVPFSIKNARVKTGISGDYTANRQSACASTGNGDQFDHLVSLASSQDANSKNRCGWIYNTQTPGNGRGAYGTRDGPLVDKTTSGTWMWNLQEAQEKYHTSICNKVMGCEDIDSSLYNNRCGWNIKAGKAIPIRGGKVAYPYNPTSNCSPENLVTKASRCPAPVAKMALNDQGKPVQIQSPAAGVCTPLPNGSLSRDCLIQRVITAGCSDDGTLVYALRAGSDTNYIDALSQTTAYKTYQERAVVGLDPASLKSGKLAAAQALDEFKKVNDHASSTQNGGLEFASRDLCFKRGIMDTYDFCSELKPSTPGPFTLDCLQKAFLKAGGQRTGSSFPTNPAPWNSYAKTWSDVLNIIQSIVGRLSSSNRAEQEAATKELYGIALESKSAAPQVSYGAVKYIRIDGGNSYLQLAQVIGYDMNGKNVTRARKVTASPEWTGGLPMYAVDGIETARSFPYVYHSGGGVGQFLQIELDSPTRLSYIRIYNRQDCCGDRLGSGYVVKLLDANMKVVWTSAKLTGASMQTVRVA